MLLNNDTRGIYAYANMTIHPSKRYNTRPLPNPIQIVEKPRTQFKGLTTDMRGRDAEVYAVCKSFKQKSYVSDLSKRLVNPIVRQEQYPQPKVRTKGINMDLKPSELDMLTKLKDDNTKMFIIQLLNAKAIGFDTLKKGTADQQAKCQKAYDVLRDRYEYLFRNSVNVPNYQDLLNTAVETFKNKTYITYMVYHYTS